MKVECLMKEYHFAVNLACTAHATYSFAGHIDVLYTSYSVA